MWLSLQPAHTDFWFPQRSSPGLLGLSRHCPINESGTTSVVPWWALSPRFSRNILLWRASVGVQYSSGVTGPVALWSFSEIAFWSFFVAHFFIGSRQESQGVWLRPILGTPPTCTRAHLCPTTGLTGWPILPGSELPDSQASQSCTELTSAFPVCQFARLMQTCLYPRGDRLVLTPGDRVLLM